MKIEREKKTKSYHIINDIKAGDVFEFRNERILMKMVENDETNAVNLEDGEQYFIDDDELILPLFATVTIKE